MKAPINMAKAVKNATVGCRLARLIGRLAGLDPDCLRPAVDIVHPLRGVGLAEAGVRRNQLGRDRSLSAGGMLVVRLIRAAMIGVASARAGCKLAFAESGWSLRNNSCRPDTRSDRTSARPTWQRLSPACPAPRSRPPSRPARPVAPITDDAAEASTTASHHRRHRPGQKPVRSVAEIDLVAMNRQPILYATGR